MQTTALALCLLLCGTLPVAMKTKQLTPEAREIVQRYTFNCRQSTATEKSKKEDREWILNYADHQDAALLWGKDIEATVEKKDGRQTCDLAVLLVKFPEAAAVVIGKGEDYFQLKTMGKPVVSGQ